MNFIAKVLAGDELDTAISDYISEWHSSESTEELHEFLGMSWNEYSLWVEQPETLRFILAARDNKVELTAQNWDEAHVLAARSQAQHKPEVLLGWLKSKGLM